MQEASRRATGDDVPALVRLLASAEEELRPLRGGALWASSRPPVDVAAEVADDAWLVLAGTIDDVVVGYARAHVATLPDGRVVGVIDDLFVEPDGRQVGVGEAMMVDVIAWCRARGCSGVDAPALPGHRATKNFFEESGFTARLLVMHRPLGDDDA